MKKIFALILSAVLLFSAFSFAEGRDYDSVTVGTFTPLTGNFFTDMWGSSTSDADVRDLLHGCSLVSFDSSRGAFIVNPTVVSGFIVTENDFHDHVYTIALYDDLKYSDGTPITAWDYAFSFLLMADPAIASIGGQAKDLSFLKGAEDYRAGRSSVISGLHVWSDRQLDITIDHHALPYFYELSYLDVNPYPIRILAPGSAVRDSGSGVCLDRSIAAAALKDALFGANGYVSHPSVVSGPYTLKSFDGSKAAFEINPYFKGDAEGNKPMFRSVAFVPVTAENAAEKLSSGEIDLINKTVSNAVTSEVMQLVGSGFGVSAYPRSGLGMISFCCERPAAASDSVRKALAMVMDKEGFTAAYCDDNGLVTEGFYGLGQWMYQIVTGTMAPPVEEPGVNATAKEQKDYENSLKQWNALSLDKVKVWESAGDQAEALLQKNGWSLNKAGAKFENGRDTVRARMTDRDGIVPLELTLCCPAGTGVKDLLVEYLAKPASGIGIEITVKEVEWDELLKLYYRQTERDCDMIFLATNFEAAFDPSTLFDPSDRAQGYQNRTGIIDNDLYRRALAMRETEPGDTYSYCRKWVAFEERFAEVMPVIPVYTNVYFDFYTDVLREYEIGAYTGWSGAIVKAYMSDAMEEKEAEEEAVRP